MTLVVRTELSQPGSAPAALAAARPRDYALGLLRVAVIAVALGLWELLSRTGVLDRNTFPPISTVLHQLYTLAGTSGFWNTVGQTMSGVGLAVLISVVIALPLGLVVGRSSFAQASSRLLIDFCQTIPAVALIPIFVLVYGSTFEMKVLLSVAAAVWPVIIQTAYGVGNVDKVADDTLRAFQIRGAQRVRMLLVPSALPYIMTGLRICAVLSLMMVTSGELLGDAPGLGHEIALAQASDAIPAMWAYVVVIGVLGISINSVLQMFEARLLRWHPSHRESERNS